MIEPAEIVALLGAGGVAEAVVRGDDASGASTRYDGLRDIRGCTRLASELAALLRTAPADAILTGPAVEDAVFAACVGAALGINVVRAFVDEGLLFAPRLQAGLRLIVTSAAFHRPAALHALDALARERGSRIVAVGTLFDAEPAALPDPAVTRVVLLNAAAAKPPP